jgi:hypothetical protein
MAERFALALPSDDDTDLAITALATARTMTLNDETVTVDPSCAWAGIAPDACFDTRRHEM